jgi:hypothetical protein
MNVMIGQIKMPNSRERQLSSGAIHFPERAFSSQGIASIGRETGVQLSGMDIFDLVDYKIMAAAGYGFNKQFQSLDDTSNFVYAGRLTMHPFGRVPFWAGDVWNSWSPLLEVSATYAYGPNALAMGEVNAIQSFDLCQAYGLASADAMSPVNGCTRPVQDELGFTQLPLGRANFHPNAIGDWKDMGFDATFMYRGFYANVEYHNMTYDPSNGNALLTQFPGLRTMTYAIDLGYFIIPREWEIVARYQYIDVNKGDVSRTGVAYNTTSSPSATADPTNRRLLDQRWWEFGTVWYLSRDHRHKIGVFGHIREEAGGDLHNNGASVNLQLAF